MFSNYYGFWLNLYSYYLQSVYISTMAEAEETERLIVAQKEHSTSLNMGFSEI